MSQFSQHISKAAGLANALFGELCSYTVKDSGQVHQGLSITIDKNKPVKDEYGMLAGYRMEASILKEELPDEPNQYDRIVDSSGNSFTISSITKDTTAKWYVSIAHG